MPNTTHPFGWVTSFVVGLIDRRLATIHDIMELNRHDWHYLAFILAHDTEWAKNSQHADYIWSIVFSMKRKKVFETLLPNVPKRALLVLSKCAGGIWHEKTYRHLGVMISDDIVHKYFTHRKSIERKHVKWMTKLPSHLRHASVIAYLEKGRKMDELIFAFDIVKILRHDLTDAQIMKSFADCKKHNIRGWVNEQMTQMTFPDAPWPGVEGEDVTLRPLVNFDDLKRTALEYKNCIRTYLTKILRGNSYFYRYAKDGKPIAVVEITHLPVLGWTVNEALGVDNDDLTNGTKRDLAHLFKNGGISVPPLNIYPSGFLNDYD